MRYVLGAAFDIPARAPAIGEPSDGREDLIPTLDGWDESSATLSIPAHDPAAVNVPAEVRLIAAPQGEPIPDAESLVRSGHPASILSPILSPYGATFSVPIPTGLDPSINYIGQTVFGFRD